MLTSPSDIIIFYADRCASRASGYWGTPCTMQHWQSPWILLQHIHDQGIPARSLLLAVLPMTSTVRAWVEKTADKVDVSPSVA